MVSELQYEGAKVYKGKTKAKRNDARKLRRKERNVEEMSRRIRVVVTISRLKNGVKAPR